MKDTNNDNGKWNDTFDEIVKNKVIDIFNKYKEIDDDRRNKFLKLEKEYRKIVSEKEELYIKINKLSEDNNNLRKINNTMNNERSIIVEKTKKQIKNHLSYRLGSVLVNAGKSNSLFSYLKIPFELKKAYNNYINNSEICSIKNNIINDIKRNNISFIPRVSVIIPIYNNYEYLNECINSVINQTIKDIEIICINDGSTDERVEKLLNSFYEKDNRITVVHKKNSGYGHSMNVGLDLAVGEFIGIVESDDYIKAEMYEKLFDASKKYNVKIVKSNPVQFFGDGKSREFKTVYITNNKNNYNKIVYPSKDNWIFRGVILNQTGIFERNFINEHKIRFNETPGAAFQDNGFYFQTMCLVEKLVFLDEEYYMLRRDNPNSSVKSKEKVFCSPNEFAFIMEFLNKDKNIKNKYIENYNLRKFISYKFNYNRISDEFKPMFYKRWRDEFIDAFKNKEINLKYYSEKEREELIVLVGEDIYSICQPKISIIMPIYNDEKFLDVSIKSALSQSIKDIELICVDDGSNDNSLDIIKKWSHIDSRVRFVKQNNQGAGPARNKGISMSIGKYIAFLDADDYYPDNDVLNKLYNCCENNNVSISGGRLSFDRNGNVVESKNNQDNFKKYGILKYTDYQYDYGFYRYIYSSKLIKHNKILFPDLIRFQDPIFFVNAMTLAKTFYAIDMPSYCYRWIPGSVEWNERQVRDLIRGLGSLLEFSYKNRLDKLHGRVIGRINNDFHDRLLNAGKKYSFVKDELIVISKFIDPLLLSNKEKNIKINVINEL